MVRHCVPWIVVAWETCGFHRGGQPHPNVELTTSISSIKLDYIEILMVHMELVIL
jgi:hypothetical protein